MSTWQSDEEPGLADIPPLGWAVALLRAVPLAVTVFGGLAVLLLLRLAERPLFGLARPVTPFITQGVCRAALIILGIRLRVQGRPMHHKGAAVANHSSWLDIFVLNAPKRIYFVSKSEVAGWPGIGWLARATGTVFINRRARDAARQKALFEARLRAGHRLMFFPEGTSTDGRQVVPFKSTLFAAFFSQGLHEAMWIQPVTVAYHAPKGADPRFYGWWGEMAFAPHLIRTLAAWRQGSVDLIYHPPLRVSDYTDRKALAADCEATVRAGLPWG